MSCNSCLLLLEICSRNVSSRSYATFLPSILAGGRWGESGLGGQVTVRKASYNYSLGESKRKWTEFAKLLYSPVPLNIAGLMTSVILTGPGSLESTLQLLVTYRHHVWYCNSYLASWLPDVASQLSTGQWSSAFFTLPPNC